VLLVHTRVWIRSGRAVENAERGGCLSRRVLCQGKMKDKSKMDDDECCDALHACFCDSGDGARVMRELTQRMADWLVRATGTVSL